MDLFSALSRILSIYCADYHAKENNIKAKLRA